MVCLDGALLLGGWVSRRSHSWVCLLMGLSIRQLLSYCLVYVEVGFVTGRYSEAVS